MRINLNKEGEGRFSLSLNSGHFSGTLGSITVESLAELHDSLSKFLEKGGESDYELKWNPRSRRLERRKKEGKI